MHHLIGTDFLIFYFFFKLDWILVSVQLRLTEQVPITGVCTLLYCTWSPPWVFCSVSNMWHITHVEDRSNQQGIQDQLISEGTSERVLHFFMMCLQDERLSSQATVQARPARSCINSTEVGEIAKSFYHPAEEHPLTTVWSWAWWQTVRVSILFRREKYKLSKHCC